jgi:hypothetical protein
MLELFADCQILLHEIKLLFTHQTWCTAQGTSAFVCEHNTLYLRDKICNFYYFINLAGTVGMIILSVNF